jgi:hypothetical protein
MTGEVLLHALGKQAFPTTLTTTDEGGTSTFRAHTGAKPVLLFPGPFGALQCPFHSKSRVRRDGAGMLRRFSLLSIGPVRRGRKHDGNCQRCPFLE